MLTLPSLSVRWGSYSKPDPEEEQKVVTTVRTAMGGGAGGGEPLITKRIAVEKIQSIFGIENIDAMLEELEAETAERQEKTLENTTAEAKALADIAHDSAPPGGQQAGQKPAPGSRGRPARPAPAKAKSGKK